MAERYTVKWQSSYGTNDATFENLDHALTEFLVLHSDGVKAQLTAEAPKEDDKDEWAF